MMDSIVIFMLGLTNLRECVFSFVIVFVKHLEKQGRVIDSSCAAIGLTVEFTRRQPDVFGLLCFFFLFWYSNSRVQTSNVELQIGLCVMYTSIEYFTS